MGEVRRSDFVPEIFVRVMTGLITFLGLAAGGSGNKIEEAIFAGAALLGYTGPASLGVLRVVEGVSGGVLGAASAITSIRPSGYREGHAGLIPSGRGRTGWRVILLWSTVS